MKKLSVLLVFVLLLSVFAGCKPIEAPPSPAAPTGSAAAPVESTAAPVESTAAPIESTAVPGDSTAAPTQTPQPAGDDDGVHPMLFHVTGPEGAEGYLFGTIHVADERVNTVLSKLLPYLDACDALAVEFDIVAYENDYAAQMASMQQFLLQDGSTVDQHMPKELFDRASALLNEAGLMPDLTKIYNLSMWSQLVEQAALMTRTDYSMEIGMDRTLIQHCYEKNIEVRDVESAELQYGLLAGFSDELNLLLIENTLDSLEDYSEAIDRLYGAWLAGSYEGLMEVLEEEDEGSEELTEAQKALLEDYNDKMLTQRNLGMRDKAVQWLEAGDKVFFAVGAAHLMDEDGLVALLRAAGYTVEQVEYR